MNEPREEIELPPLEHSQQDIERACGRLYERYYGKDESDMRRDIASLERQLKSSLTANREQKAEIERLKACTQLHNDSAVEAWQLTQKWQKRVFDLEAEKRASVGEKWIDVKQELPPANKNHCWLAWITSQNKNGGYIDLVSYGEYICFNEECHEGDANYVEHDDGNMKRDGWYREEETHGGEFDYIFVDLNDKVTHWQPLPVAPTLPGEEK